MLVTLSLSIVSYGRPFLRLRQREPNHQPGPRRNHDTKTVRYVLTNAPINACIAYKTSRLVDMCEHHTIRKIVTHRVFILIAEKSQAPVDTRPRLVSGRLASYLSTFLCEKTPPAKLCFTVCRNLHKYMFFSDNWLQFAYL